MADHEQVQPDLAKLREGVRMLSKHYATSVRDILLHFQGLISAHSSRLMMEAPGLYCPKLSFYFISKSGMKKGHSEMLQEIHSLLQDDGYEFYGFVLYPESFVRTCLDRLLRRNTKNITRDLRISMENIYNKKHYSQDFVDSDLEKDIIDRLKRELGTPEGPNKFKRNPKIHYRDDDATG